MHRLTVLLVAMVLVAACVGDGTGGPGRSSDRPDGPPAATGAPSGIELASADLPLLASTPDDAAAGAAAVNAFGLAVYRALVAYDPDHDLVMSPASIALALAMARAGARGATADEMDEVLLDFGADDNAAWAAALDQALSDRTGTFSDAMQEPQEVTLRNVHGAFAQRGWTLEPAYLEALATRYAAGLWLVDYVNAWEEARSQINRWVADETEDRIEDLLAQGDVDSLTRLVLVNAIYLKAAWLVPFEEAATQPAPFTRLDATTTNVLMMHATGAFPYASGDGWRAIELPYVGEQLAMLVIVPDELAAFEETLDEARVGDIVAALEGTQVELGFPKFGIETRIELTDALSQLGMPTAFTDDADFSGISAQEPVRIDTVLHQANIDVDEAGTEAAAATAVVMAATGAVLEPVELTVDRPFLYALRDRITGAILFLGRATEPTERDR